MNIARALLEIGAVGFTPQTPITFKSGIKSPVYVDNRRLPYHPPQWHIVIEGFTALIREQSLSFDIFAGVEMGGVPHCAALAYILQCPSVVVRKTPKEHGTQKLIEGGAVENRRVLLIEDLVTTGESSLKAVQTLRGGSAVVEDCIAIVSYGFKETLGRFAEANVHLYTLTTFPVILSEALHMGKFTADEKAIIEDWLHDPYGWAARRGL
jgi:orotate phosphoribosyltransferase